MLFATDDDDNDFSLTPGGGGSNLASLFSSGQSKVDNSNQSLKYTPPKQPKKQEPTQGVPALLHAAVVTAYKFDGGHYVNQGKMGAAILENHDPLMIRIILYKNKQHPLSTTTISVHFNFTIQANNYASFYDNQKVNWSVLFDSEQLASEFARHVAFTKAKVHGSHLNSPLIQDLNFGEGNEVDNGDSIEIKYTGWIMSNYTCGEMFDSNENSDKFLRLKLGKGKVIKGLEEGLVGVRKNCKRLVIVPPHLGYDSQEMSKIPPKSTLIFEVFVNKVKFGKETSRSSTPSVNEVDSGSEIKKRDSISTKTHSPSIGSEDSIRARGVSISEQLSQSPKDEKAKIISRMAKMGMSLLPKQIGGTSQQSSESETDEEIHSKARSSPVTSQENLAREQSPKPVPKPRSTSNATNFQQLNQPAPTPVTQQMAVMQPPQYLPNNIYPFPYSASTVPFNMLQQPFPNHAIATGSPAVMTSIADTHLPLLLSETRTQNTEVRLALGKITEKVDVVLHKLDDVKHQSAFSGQIPYLESSVLLQNIQRIVQENNKLKQEIDEKSGKIQSLNEKICDLLQRNQRFIEESNSMLEQRSDSLHSTASQSHARLLTLEQERIKLSSELAETISKVSELQLELSAQQQQEMDLKNKLQTATYNSQKQKDETESFKLKIQEQEILITTLQQNLKEIRQEKRDLEKKLENLEETIEDFKSTKEMLEKSLTERKKQIQDERIKAENAIEETRTSYEKEIEMIRNKYLNKRLVPSSEQVTEIEDVESKWKKRSEQMILETAEKYKEEIEVLNKEKTMLECKLKEIESKLEKSRTNQSSERDRIFQLEEEIENLKEWKLKYELLGNSSETMKKQYEEQIKELTRLLNQGGSFAESSVKFSNELKTAMNRLYRCLQTEFHPENSYSGARIRQVALNTIRAVTFELIEAKQTVPVSRDEPDKTEIKGNEETVKKQMPDNEVSHSENNSNQTSSETEASKETENDTPVSTVPIEDNSKLEDNITSQTKIDSSNLKSVGETLNQNDDSSKLDKTKVDVVNSSNDALKENEMAVKTDQSENEEDKSGKESSPIEKTQISEKSSKLIEEEKKNIAKTQHSASPDNSDSGEDTSSKQYLFFDNKSKSWIPQPPPPPLFDDDDEDEDDWLK
ncbi:FK506-binding protein 15-like isoform X4 [Centruroides vittatus]|uniref:FK506-binding protein 15-like isoform X4 n=1 Tax=Centruroides vittatus TaxID=120091 RepID=UPI0035109A0B